MKQLKVLIACEESQAECIAWRELGHVAYSCDIKECRRGMHPEWHIKGDVTPLLDGATVFKTQDGHTHRIKRWDLIIAHPPCTYLCKQGSIWMHNHKQPDGKHYQKLTSPDPERYQLMKQAREFFLRCLHANVHYLAIENPLPMAMAQLPQPTFYIHPSWFGVKYTKKTLYWTKNLPPIMPEIEHPNPKQFVRSSRGHYRSRTFPEVARAIARQWSQYILDDIDRQS